MTQCLPLWIVTGFLGSGKTTLIRSLIRIPELGRLAVVINEFGEAGLDHDLVEASSDDTFMLAGGCLCCMVRGDLIETLTDLVARRAVGELPPFDGVVIETSGLADPWPVLHMLLTTPSFVKFYRLKGIITMVDALNARHVLASEELAKVQLAAADHVVLAKTDICSESECAALLSELGNAVPGAPIHTIVAGEIASIQGLASLLAQEEGDAKACANISIDAAFSRAPRHDLAHVSAYTVELATPLSLEKLDACISLLSSLAGPQLLRGKGLIVLPAPRKPVVVQAVQEMVYPPMPLVGRPEEPLRSRLVLITRDIDEESIDDLLAERKLPRLHAGDRGLGSNGG